MLTEYFLITGSVVFFMLCIYALVLGTYNFSNILYSISAQTNVVLCQDNMRFNMSDREHKMFATQVRNRKVHEKRLAFSVCLFFASLVGMTVCIVGVLHAFL